MTDRRYDPNAYAGPDWVYADPTEDELEIHRAVGPYIGESGDLELLRSATHQEHRWQTMLADTFAKGQDGVVIGDEEIDSMWRVWRKLHLSRYGKPPVPPRTRS